MAGRVALDVTGRVALDVTKDEPQAKAQGRMAAVMSDGTRLTVSNGRAQALRTLGT